MNAGSLVERSLNAKRLLQVILPLFLGSVIAYLDRVNLAYAALTMNKDLGFTASVFGLGAGIFFAGYVLFEIPGALIAERWSARIWLARIMVSWGLISWLMAYVRTEWQFYALRFLLGAAEASFYPVAYASVIPRWFTAAERPRALALMLTSLPVSAILGSPLAGWLLTVNVFGLKGWQTLFVLEAIPALLFGLVIAVWLKDWPKDAPWLSDSESRHLSEAYEREVAAKRARRQFTVWQALRDREVLKLCLIYFLWITGFWGYNYWMPTVLQETSGWSSWRVGWMVVIPMSLALGGMVFIGYSSARTGEKRWHGAIPLFLAALGMGLGPFIKDPFGSFACVCLAGIGVYGAFGVWWSYPTTFLSGAAAAGAIGLINSFGNVGGFLGPYFTGVIKDLTGSVRSAYVLLAISLLAAGLLMVTLRKTPAAGGPAMQTGAGAG
ncbi:MAG: MFS transporter [Verrucomicrobia bacterium]|nr:MFS transporter [Verrucomicrobiota bacterium]